MACVLQVEIDFYTFRRNKAKFSFKTKLLYLYHLFIDFYFDCLDQLPSIENPSDVLSYRRYTNS